ncbi:hypothetical protein Goklo_012428 [Gossypium klotzschianum]|uniref:RNase H type-1 domain-containing protein n=1 Tax=Gossypium klotzschianum TaxID=34286 RepID=A0A7J8VD84_9ROSI|nr:hypothetical protein [Gossypium klotzschianum]
MAYCLEVNQHGGHVWKRLVIAYRVYVRNFDELICMSSLVISHFVNNHLAKPILVDNLGTLLHEVGGASTGIIIRNNTGLIMRAVCLWNRYVPNELAVEVLASTQALRFAQELGFWKVEVEVDSLVVIMKF